MAQGKVVDYNLMLAAGAATVKPVSEEKDTVFSKFLDMAGEYAAFQQHKTKDFIASMPNVDLAKVDDAMTEETSAWISGKRDIVVKASKQMTWYPSWTKKYKEAVSEYNEATQAIVNYSNNLDMVKTERERLIGIGPTNLEGTEFIIINANELINGDMFGKMDIEDNGNIIIKGFLNQTTGDAEDMLFRDYGGPNAEDNSLQQLFYGTSAEVNSQKSHDISKTFNIDQSNSVNTFNEALGRASDEQLIGFLKRTHVPGSAAGTTMMEQLLTGGTDTVDGDGNFKLNQEDASVGLGLTLGSPEYDAAVLALSDPKNYTDEIKEELRQFTRSTFQTSFNAFDIGAKPPTSEARKDTGLENAKVTITKVMSGETVYQTNMYKDPALTMWVPGVYAIPTGANKVTYAGTEYTVTKDRNGDAWNGTLNTDMYYAFIYDQEAGEMRFFQDQQWSKEDLRRTFIDSTRNPTNTSWVSYEEELMKIKSR